MTTSGTDRLAEEVAGLEPDSVKGFPFQEYAAYLRDVKSYFGFARHPHVARARRSWFKCLVSSHEPAFLCRVNKLVLASLMKENRPRLRSLSLPGDVPELYEQWFDRIVKDLRDLPDDAFRLESIDYIIDLSVCCLRSIPVGGAWVVQKSRVGLGPFVGGGLRQFFQYSFYVFSEAGGLSPYWVIHTAARYVLLFRPEEMDRAYMRIAGLLQWDPSTKGIFRAGWLLDPALEHVSPSLAFVRNVPQENGARFFRGRTSQSDMNLALSRSSARRRLYKDGSYRPSTHAYIWPKEAVISWASTQEEGDSPGGPTHRATGRDTA